MVTADNIVMLILEVFLKAILWHFKYILLGKVLFAKHITNTKLKWILK